MHIRQEKKLVDTDLLIIPCFREKNLSTKNVVAGIKDLQKMELRVPKIADFKGKKNETCVYYPYPYSKKIKRILFWGLGRPEKLTSEKFRRYGANLRKTVENLTQTKQAEIILSSDQLIQPDFFSAFVDGFYLGGYKFHSYKTKKKKESFQELAVYFAKTRKSFEKIIRERLAILRSVSLVRDVVNIPSNEKYPDLLAQIVQRELAESKKIRTKILKEEDIKRLKMKALLAVAQGSQHPPRVITMQYKSSKRKTKTILIVGKGITFDSGGINLKPGGSIETMKLDLAGAAVVLGIFKILASGLDLPVNVVGIIGAAENMPGPSATRPGDIVTAHNGKTIEITNTDAEGRVLLADCISYGIKKFKPDYSIDVATLTGACLVALGHHIAGLVSSSAYLVDNILKASEKTGEKVWNLPLDEDLVEKVKGDISDFKNYTSGVHAGTIMGGAFIKEFVGKTPWAHLDIAGTGWADKPEHYISKGGTGWGVRLLWNFLRSF